MTQDLFSYDDALRFFNILSHNPKNTKIENVKEVFTAYLMHECGKGKGKPMKNFATIHGTTEELLIQYEAAISEIEDRYKIAFDKNGNGCRNRKHDPDPHTGVCPPSMHVVLNETNMQGRKIKDITGVRVLAVDLDREVQVKELKKIVSELSPELVVESSPDRYHLYWRIQPTSKANWQELQIALAEYLEGDTTLDQANKTLRVPGFFRIKTLTKVTNDGEEITGEVKFKPQVKYYNAKGRARTYNQFRKAWDWVDGAIEDAKEKRVSQFSANREIALAFFKNSDLTEGINSGEDSENVLQSKEKTILKASRTHGRNNTMYSVLKAYGRAAAKNRLPVEAGAIDGIDLEGLKKGIVSELAEMARAINDLFDESLDLSEVESIFVSVTNRVTDWLDSRVTFIKEYHENLMGKVSASDDDTDPDGGSGSGKKKKKKRISRADYAHDRKYREIEIVKSTPVKSEANLKGDTVVDDLARAGVIEPLEAHQIKRKESEVFEKFNSDTHKTVTSNANSLPDSIAKAAEDFAEFILTNNAKMVASILVGDVKIKNTIGTSQLIVKEFMEFGSCSKAGPCVVIKSESTWGTTVANRIVLTKEQWLAFINRTMHRVVLYLIHDGKRYGAGGVVKKMATGAVIKKISDGTWEECLLAKKNSRQKPNIIAFQNGYLELDKRRFVLDDRTAVKFSHPIHANFRPELAGVIKSRNYSGMLGMLKELGVGSTRFLDDWFPDDDDTIDIILTWMGYCFTTDVSKQKFIFMYGPTGAGKGSISQVLCGIVGAANYAGAEYKVLDGGFKASALYDKLIVSIEECGGTPGQHRSRLEFLKKITGGERMQIEPKYVNPFDDYLIGKFILQSNSVPTYEDEGGAISQRMIPLGFEHSYRSKGTHVLPSRQILEDTITVGAEGETFDVTVPDILATMAGLLWMERREYTASFLPETNSKAVDAGKVMMDKGMNLIKSVLHTYFEEVDTRKAAVTIPTAALREFIEWYADDEQAEIPTSTRLLNNQIREHMAELYPDCKVVRPRIGSSADPKTERGRKRCWSNLTISDEFDVLLCTLEEETSWMGTYRELAEWVEEFSPILKQKRSNIANFM